MRPFRLCLAAFLACTRMLAASDPFVGTWVYNPEKSPKPTIRYAVKDLGGGRFALTGSTGETTEIKADGVPVQSASGQTVSFRKLDDHTWQMDRDEGLRLVRTYTVSADDTTLTLHDVYTGTPGSGAETTARYTRLSPGKSLFGEWQSVSVEDKVSGAAFRLIIAPFGTDGLSFQEPESGHLSQMNFDGKSYPDTGPKDHTGHTSSGKRLGDRVLQIESERNGQPESHGEIRVSDDGQTLTITDRPVHSATVFTIVCDKQ